MKRDYMRNVIKTSFVAFALIVALAGFTVCAPSDAFASEGATEATVSAASATVSEVPITSVSFPQSVNLKVGEAKTLTVTTKPANTTYLTNIVWGNQTNGCYENKVNGYGTYWNKPSSITVTGSSAGTGYMTVDVNVYDSNKNKVTCYKLRSTITVKDGAATQPTTQSTTQPTQPTTKPVVALKSISLSKSSVSLTPKQTASLSVSYNPTNTTASRSITWSSSNAAVAKVSGGKIIAVKAGTATITANCSGKTASCKVTVKAVEKYRDVSEAYTLLNKFRTTKSNQWYWKSNNKSKKKVTGLKKLKKDAALEKVAKLRAKEQWIMYYERGKATHTRPNGKSWKTAYPSGMKYRGENLAWGYETCKSVVTDADGWAETNEKYSGQGHRRNMLNKNFTKVGIACYEKDGETCWAMCLGK